MDTKTLIQLLEKRSGHSIPDNKFAKEKKLGLLLLQNLDNLDRHSFE
jgi:hypothetical protein